MFRTILSTRFVNKLHPICQASGGFFRPFFASSTDHTRLLADSEVHSWELKQEDGGNTIKQFVLVAYGMDLDMVHKVPQLHLARLFLSSDTMWGAKVVNRTLGDPSHVCAKLVDAARSDGALRAKSSLHGLSDYVLNKSPSESLVAVAEGRHLVGDYGDDNDDVLRIQWETHAREYIETRECLEANLYLDKGAVLTKILHHEDTSDFADTCGGAMALLEFP